MENIDYVIGEEYILPSNGAIYDKPVDKFVKLRSMTTNEEMKRLSTGERKYKIMADIIDDCLVEKPGISCYDMCIGDYQFLLHKLRVVTYGPDYQLQCKCKMCGFVSDETIDLDSMQVKENDETTIKDLFEFDLPVSKKHITLNVQTPRMMDNIQMDIRDFKKRYPKSTVDSALLFTLKHLIKFVDGEKLDPIDGDEWLRSLPMRDTNLIILMAEKAAGAIGLDTEVEIECPLCGLTYTSPFRFTSEFFGPRDDV